MRPSQRRQDGMVCHALDSRHSGDHRDIHRTEEGYQFESATRATAYVDSVGKGHDSRRLQDDPHDFGRCDEEGGLPKET